MSGKVEAHETSSVLMDVAASERDSNFRDVITTNTTTLHTLIGK